MIEHVVVVALAGVLYGWLWAAREAHLLDPIRGPIEDYAVKRRDSSYLVLDAPPRRWRRRPYRTIEVGGRSGPNRVRIDRPGWEWVLNRIGCPVCMGFDATVVAHLALSDWRFGWPSIPLIAAANGLHVLAMLALKR